MSEPRLRQQSKEKDLFAQHPLVTTFLWLLGRDTELEPTPSFSGQDEDEPCANKLSWKDDHGGNIAEYLGHVQKVGDGELSRSSQARNHLRANGVAKPGKAVSQVNGAKKSDELSSPQWGFYVSITPPQEQFARQAAAAAAAAGKEREKEMSTAQAPATTS